MCVDTVHKGDDDDDDDNNNNNNNNNNAIRIWEQKTVYITPVVLPTTAITPNKLHYSLKLPYLRPAL
jgi:hypothetical protein